jgi:DNA-binding transcriptional LysR family regulator
VDAGLGVAVVPRLALPRGAHPVLVARPLVDPLVERATGLVLRRGGVPAPAARALLDLLTERLAAGQKPWTGRRRQRRGQAERSD